MSGAHERLLQGGATCATPCMLVLRVEWGARRGPCAGGAASRATHPCDSWIVALTHGGGGSRSGSGSRWSAPLRASTALSSLPRDRSARPSAVVSLLADGARSPPPPQRLRSVRMRRFVQCEVVCLCTQGNGHARMSFSCPSLPGWLTVAPTGLTCSVTTCWSGIMYGVLYPSKSLWVELLSQLLAESCPNSGEFARSFAETWPRYMGATSVETASSVANLGGRGRIMVQLLS